MSKGWNEMVAVLDEAVCHLLARIGDQRLFGLGMISRGGGKWMFGEDYFNIVVSLREDARGLYFVVALNERGVGDERPIGETHSISLDELSAVVKKAVERVRAVHWPQVPDYVGTEVLLRAWNQQRLRSISLSERGSLRGRADRKWMLIEVRDEVQRQLEYLGGRPGAPPGDLVEFIGVFYKNGLDPEQPPQNMRDIVALWQTALENWHDFQMIVFVRDKIDELSKQSWR